MCYIDRYVPNRKASEIRRVPHEVVFEYAIVDENAKVQLVLGPTKSLDQSSEYSLLWSSKIEMSVRDADFDFNTAIALH